MMTVISPHLDDAVLSLGQWLATGPEVEVVTICAGRPTSDVLTDYDALSGWRDSYTAMSGRRVEDHQALARLGPLRYRHLDFLDGQYGEPLDLASVTAQVAALYSQHHHMFVPLGIGHPDHRLVATACRAINARELLLYEELPYRVLWPEEAHDALEQVRAEGWTVDPLPWPLEQGDRAKKAAAIACYGSQFPDGADDPCLLVPERCWRATR